MLGLGATGAGALWRVAADAPQTQPRPSAAGMFERVLAHADRSLSRSPAAGSQGTSSAAGPAPTSPLDAAADPRVKPAPTSNPAQSQRGPDAGQSAKAGKRRDGSTTSPPPATTPGDETAAPPPGSDSAGNPARAGDAAPESSKADRSSEAAGAAAGSARARQLEARVVDLVNAERAEEGCDPLRTDARLQRAAAAHSADMARSGHFSHTSPDGRSPWERVQAQGYSQPSGENIARGYDSPHEVVDAWMDSEGHRENIVNCKSQATGVGVYFGGDGGPYWTQVFGYK